MLVLGLVDWGFNKSGMIQISLFFVVKYITTPTPRAERGMLGMQMPSPGQLYEHRTEILPQPGSSSARARLFWPLIPKARALKPPSVKAGQSQQPQRQRENV